MIFVVPSVINGRSLRHSPGTIKKYEGGRCRGSRGRFRVRECRWPGHRARTVSVIRLRSFPVVSARDSTDRVEDGIGGSIENFWSTRFQSFPCESTINTIFQGGPFDCSSIAVDPPDHEGVTFPIMSSLENILSASSGPPSRENNSVMSGKIFSRSTPILPPCNRRNISLTHLLFFAAFLSRKFSLFHQPSPFDSFLSLSRYFESQR